MKKRVSTSWTLVVCLIVSMTVEARGQEAMHPTGSGEVTERDGHIWLLRNGVSRQLTDGSRDEEPALAPGGDRVVFSRRIAEYPSDPPDTHLMLVHVATRETETLVTEVEVSSQKFRSLSRPVFHPDGRSVFFMVRLGSVVDSMLMKMDLVTRRTSLIARSILYYCSIVGGRYHGYVLTAERTRLIENKKDSFWLYSSDGVEVGLVGVESPLETKDRAIAADVSWFLGVTDGKCAFR